jgi:hypothetical protein
VPLDGAGAPSGTRADARELESAPETEERMRARLAQECTGVVVEIRRPLRRDPA